MSQDGMRIQQRLQRGAFVLDVDLQLPGRGVTALFGRSGSGKTSVLRCVAGLERDTQGQICIKGQVWQQPGRFVPTHRRPLGYVVQESNLFPHLSVRGNLDFARKRADSGAMTLDQVVEMLNLVALLERQPATISAGERQRVAIARALLIGPQLLLMDEPMASLDRQSKTEILPYLEQLHRQLEIPVIYVSHSADEVARLADHLVVMDQGRVVGEGPLTEMLGRLDFPLRLDDETGVVWEGTAGQYDARWQLAQIRTAGGDLWVRSADATLRQGVRLRILARDVSLALSHPQDSSILNILPGQVEEIGQEADGASALVRVRLKRASLLARITLKSVEYLQLQPGSRVWVQIKSVALVP